MSAANSVSWVGTDASVRRHVHVCGLGHLSAATRHELVRLGIFRPCDYLLRALRPPLVIACADSEADDSATDDASAALRNGSPLLLACLLDRVIRIGPLVEPQPGLQRRGFAPTAALTAQAPAQAETRIELLARLGALLVGAQTLNYLLGARRQCVLDRVVELNPWAIESTGYRLFKVRH